MLLTSTAGQGGRLTCSMSSSLVSAASPLAAKRGGGRGRSSRSISFRTSAATAAATASWCCSGSGLYEHPARSISTAIGLTPAGPLHSLHCTMVSTELREAGGGGRCLSWAWLFCQGSRSYLAIVRVTYPQAWLAASTIVRYVSALCANPARSTMGDEPEADGALRRRVPAGGAVSPEPHRSSSAGCCSGCRERCGHHACTCCPAGDLLSACFFLRLSGSGRGVAECPACGRAQPLFKF